MSIPFELVGESASVIETLAIADEGQAPKLDWDNLPPHITKEAAVDFAAYLQHKGADEKNIAKLYNEVRYLDKDQTEKAVELLANRVKEVIGDKPYCFVFHGYPDDTRKSGHWYSQQVISKHGLNEPIGGKPLLVNELVEYILQGKIAHETQIIVLDDLAIYWEQIIDDVVLKVEKECGEQWLANMTVALLAGTDYFIQKVASNPKLEKIKKIVRVFKVKTFDEIGISFPSIRFMYGSYIAFFTHDRVSDRFCPNARKSEGMIDEQGKRHFLINDLIVPPPYEPDRFSPGGRWYDFKQIFFPDEE